MAITTCVDRDYQRKCVEDNEPPTQQSTTDELHRIRQRRQHCELRTANYVDERSRRRWQRTTKSQSQQIVDHGWTCTEVAAFVCRSQAVPSMVNGQCSVARNGDCKGYNHAMTCTGLTKDFMSVMVLYDAALRNIPNHHSDYFGVSIGGGDGDVSGGTGLLFASSSSFDTSAPSCANHHAVHDSSRCHVISILHTFQLLLSCDIGRVSRI